MRFLITLALSLALLCPVSARSQNCCAPSVPQQGLTGETVALPQTLQIGLHFQYLRAEGMYQCGEPVEDPGQTSSTWDQTTLTLSYGFSPRLGATAVIPYVWKCKKRYLPAVGQWISSTSDGIGDITLLVRYSPLARSFVNYRELSFGVGLKFPTGATDRRNFDFLLPEELQPGSGSWDVPISVSYYQGFEAIDFNLSATYLLTTEYDGYKFGEQFSYLASASLHVTSRLDLSLALSGIARAKDSKGGEALESTGRQQVWLVPGVQFEVLADKLMLQAFAETPLYQHFNGMQLASDFNIRVTAVGTLPLVKSEDED